MKQSLFDGTIEQGSHELKWNGQGAGGITLPSGIYYLCLKTDDYVSTKKMVLLR